ncbi:hypothetical protein A2446_02345 [Candidatus Roizmanbacteria bacterium RIFOXYC2_FULL_38_9]|uniref:RNA polymerase sigma factor n=1 Tax=Candidatus Roizmanbacteria bacterium RIFOXYD1_FULL_38_12 TaxID=1802093 RepID=A0A1F7L0C7_9BACT|nr:MAG: hypothetical protein A3K47_02020 [Candidatus Roizmanbacteria bacterium RIFOXYA2_FULL_38_14]OGK63555.1 MAG: hypothetical protein A3K27_02020 [Candidatus Roizmanbacteria bacterium RIFOXYA1_FULL_37_12]OGK65401.1 MAG: hypothetical protein A3K38_02020 [Candidatus Roizmanbacteria bacterium RIFOXYB1_FULL_40_23]OGK69806.1 MAG: hypothetical protein A3K21_02025 [Candidatus Roizmanbacteria bacterium RIFOXYC1_FULL_38_14]OGK72429.1 MAG: hypothetical protein A2446_02345 [Candidatus Roizmanbacteria ba
MPRSYTKMDIENLVKLGQKGDIDSYGKLFELLSDEIFRYCMIQLHSVPDSEDIVSETFKKAWSYIYKYKKDNFRAFLYAIARNLIYDYFDDKKKTNITNIDTFEKFDKHDGKSEILDKVTKDDECQKLHEAIAQLPQDYKEIVILRFIEDLPVQEVAVIIDKSPESVRVTQHRAIAKLKQILNNGR